MRKRQSPTSIAVDSQYVASSPCVVCGRPTMSLAVRCPSCLAKSYLQEELKFAKEWLQLHPDADISLGHDRFRLLHLVCFRTKELGWCGGKVTERKSKQKRVKRGQLPEFELCKSCYAKYMEVSV